MSETLSVIDEQLQKLADIQKVAANPDRDKATSSDEKLVKGVEEAAEAIRKQKAALDAREEAIRGREEQIEQTEKLRKANEHPIFKSLSLDIPEPRRAGGLQQFVEKRTAPDDAWLKKVHAWNDDVLLASLCLQKPPTEVLKRVPELGEFLRDEIYKGTSELAKALAAATSGAGADWIPTIFSPELVDLIRVERVLASAFRRHPMKSGSERMNQLTQEMRAFKVAESTSNSVYTVPSIISDPGTGNILLTAVEVAVASIFSKTFEEDSIVPALPEVRRRIIEGMAKGIEDAMINSVASVTHPDSGVAADDVETLWDDSLRAVAQGVDMLGTTGTVSLDGANMTADNVLKLKLLQGRFGAMDSDNLFVTSPQGVIKMFGLRDANSNQILLRVDTFGPRAVLLTGAVASLFGSDVLVSDLVKTTLDATPGVVPPTPDTKTQLIRFNKAAFVIGERRDLTIESDTLPLTRQRVLVATMRLIMRRVKASQTANDRPVTIGRNIETT